MKFHLPQKLLTAFALILSLGFLVWGATAAQAATFSLSPASGSTVSGTFTVTLGLADLAGKEVSGVDVYLNYEPSKLEAVSVSHSSGIFTSYPLETIDSSGGQIAVGASASAFSPVTTTGTIATISFRALAISGSTTLSFDYTAGSTTDSNITEAGTATDILTQPPTVTYNFGGTTTTPTTPTTPSAGNGTPKGGETPEGGVVEPTILISFLSMMLAGTGVALRVKKRITPTFEEKILKNL
jgi:hypothetical protein